MVTWTQMYMPMGGLGLSALVALIPIIFFFVALAVLRLKGHVAGAITLILSILIAIFAFKMPIDMAFAAAGYGFIGNDSNLLIVFYVQIMPDDF
ncbi:L-lactate permease, partial [Escherichia coli]|uniref:L-lactate permease n=1 Tax=Escherichia coli TaxID=562 RepID=UPI000A3ADB66